VEVYDFLSAVVSFCIIFGIKKNNVLFILKKMAPAVGIEPTTIVLYLLIYLLIKTQLNIAKTAFFSNQNVL